MKSSTGIDGGTRNILTILAKGLGAFVYSWIHIGLLFLLIGAIAFLFRQIISLPWFWIVLIMFFLWGAVSAIRSLIGVFLSMPYHYFAKESALVLILPVICIVTSAIAFLVGVWQGCGEIGEWSAKSILCGLFITYECIALVWYSIVGMFISRG